MTELLTVWEEITEAFNQIEGPAVRRVQGKLGAMKDDERPLGVIHNESLKRLWALADVFEGRSSQAVVDKEHKAETDDEKEAFQCAAVRYSALEDFVRNLFWCQAKDDIGAWGHTGRIGLRADWMLVCAPSADPLKGVLGLLGGFPIIKP